MKLHSRLKGLSGFKIRCQKICKYSTEFINKIYQNRAMWIAGWGLNGTITFLMAVLLLPVLALLGLFFVVVSLIFLTKPGSNVSGLGEKMFSALVMGLWTVPWGWPIAPSSWSPGGHVDTHTLWPWFGLQHRVLAFWCLHGNDSFIRVLSLMSSIIV